MALRPIPREDAFEIDTKGRAMKKLLCYMVMWTSFWTYRTKQMPLRPIPREEQWRNSYVIWSCERHSELTEQSKCLWDRYQGKSNEETPMLYGHVNVILNLQNKANAFETDTKGRAMKELFTMLYGHVNIILNLQNKANAFDTDTKGRFFVADVSIRLAKQQELADQSIWLMEGNSAELTSLFTQWKQMGRFTCWKQLLLPV